MEGYARAAGRWITRIRPGGALHRLVKEVCLVWSSATQGRVRSLAVEEVKAWTMNPYNESEMAAVHREIVDTARGLREGNVPFIEGVPEPTKQTSEGKSCALRQTTLFEA